MEQWKKETLERRKETRKRLGWREENREGKREGKIEKKRKGMKEFPEGSALDCAILFSNFSVNRRCG